MKKIKMLVDETSFKSKPTGYEVSQIQLRLRQKKAIKELSIEELFEDIKKGFTFVPAVLKNGAKNENWEQQEVIFIDVDNSDKDIITINQALNILKTNNIEPIGYYNTFSSTNDKPKYRLIFALNKPIFEIKKIELIINTLIKLVKGDEACKNLSRIFYGTNGDEKDVVLLNENATISLDSIISIYNKDTNSDDNDNDNDLKSLISTFDLLEYMKKSNTISHTSGNITYFDNCVICGHHDCLRYYKDTNSFYCFGQNGCIGGSIIDYIMATEKIDRHNAINYFKYQLLNLPKTSQTEIDLELLDIVRKQIKDIGLEEDFIKEEDFNWIVKEKNKSFVKTPILYDFIKRNLNYIFVRNKAKEGTLRYYYDNGYYRLISDEEFKGMIKHFIPLELQKTGVINETFNLLLTDLKYTQLDKLNNENIINFNNGVLDLGTGELKPHSPKYLSTIRIPCEYKEKVELPKTLYFDNFINKLTNNDEDIRKLILEVMGVVISNVKGYRMKKALIMFGKGNTGKSVLKNFLTFLIGQENCSNIDLRKMEEKFGKVQLLNKRLVGSNDMSWAKVIEMETLKQAVGGDPIYAEFKGENGINFIFNGVLWFCTNQLPMFGGDKGDWVYDRFIIIKCNNVIPEKEQDKNLIEHLMQEKDYIISLAIDGLKQVISNGYRYDIPESCILLNEEYKDENSSFRKFLKECCIPRVKGEKIPDDNCTKGKIHKVYKQWYRENYRGNGCETTSEIKRLLESMGKYHVVSANKGNEYYADFTLNEKTKKEYADIIKNNNYHIDEPMELEGYNEEELLF